MATIIVDIEVYRDIFYVGMKRLEDGKRLGFERSNRRDFDAERLQTILRKNLIVTFNGQTYDLPLIWYAIAGASNKHLKAASDRIIQTNVKWWEVERLLGIDTPKIDHIDTIEPNPSVRQGLKTLNGRLHGRHMADLPFEPDARLSSDEMDLLIEYCQNDLDATELVYTSLKEPLELRAALSQQYGMDLRSKSDAQMGEAIIKKRVEAITGNRPQRLETLPPPTFRYAVPDFLSFQTRQLRDVLELVRGTEFEIQPNGKVAFPTAFEKLKLAIGGSVYTLGIGGLHSTEANRAVHSDDDHVLIDADVASQYPSIIMKLGLYPQALGPAFLEVYGGLIQDRLVAKRSGDKVKDKAGKIALNGAYGKLGSVYSVLYAPHLLIAVTLTGQLSLLMLIERADLAGIPVISGNTDGVVFRCPRHREADLKAIIAAWEEATGFVMETARYRSLYNASVNTYVAVKDDGKLKRKGAIANPWSSNKDEHDLRGQMMKNPQMTICSDAAVAYLIHGTPLRETIMSCRDVRAFVTVVRVTGGGTWRGDYLGKVVRYIWSTDGAPILYSKPHPTTGNLKKVSKSDGCRPVMTLPTDLPADIDIDRYVEEARSILVDIGHFHPRAITPEWRLTLAMVA